MTAILNETPSGISNTIPVGPMPDFQAATNPIVKIFGSPSTHEGRCYKMLNNLKKKLWSGIIKTSMKILKEPVIQDKLWEITNRGNFDVAISANRFPKNPRLALWEDASRTTAEYMSDHMVACPVYPGRYQLFDKALSRVNVDGLHLEFGSGWKGKSIDYLADHIDGVIHGFDSFEGLPEEWFGEYGVGSLSSSGKLPKVKENVHLHKGWFDDVLPEFLKHHVGPAAFLHIDCDVYKSAKTVFNCLGEKIVSGTVIQFDEYFNYPGWKNHEYKAFQEFVSERGLSYQYIGYAEQYAVAVQIQ